ncbi:hypothetical protein A1S_3657 [Acinetobacter baumannii ATCC 17978]|nr:hypothetical protein A1S_3657 [Acinetobacter baumannii ATCC 17978]
MHQYFANLILVNFLQIEVNNAALKNYKYNYTLKGHVRPYTTRIKFIFTHWPAPHQI